MAINFLHGIPARTRNRACCQILSQDEWLIGDEGEPVATLLITQEDLACQRVLRPAGIEFHEIARRVRSIVPDEGRPKGLYYVWICEAMQRANRNISQRRHTAGPGYLRVRKRARCHSRTCCLDQGKSSGTRHIYVSLLVPLSVSAACNTHSHLGVAQLCMEGLSFGGRGAIAERIARMKILSPKAHF